MKLLLDEMYTKDIAQGLRERGHAVDSVAERRDLVSLPDRLIFQAAQAEERVLVTNDIRGYKPLGEQALRDDEPFYGIYFTNDRTIPRTRGTIGRFVDLLDAELGKHAAVEALPERFAWLPRERPS